MPITPVACVLVIGTAPRVLAQCAYPVLELLEFDYVKSPQVTAGRRGEEAAQNVCLTAPTQHPDKQEIKASGIEYEFQGRLFIFQRILRWLHLGTAADAWASLHANSPSPQLLFPVSSLLPIFDVCPLPDRPAICENPSVDISNLPLASD